MATGTNCTIWDIPSSGKQPAVKWYMVNAFWLYVPKGSERLGHTAEVWAHENCVTQKGGVKYVPHNSPFLCDYTAAPLT